MQARDQAHGLRLIAERSTSTREQQFVPQSRKANPDIRIIAVTSGKGGVGKTNITVNLAIALQRLGNRVLVIDADLGLANVDVLMGITPKYNLRHLMQGDCDIEEVIIRGPEGILIVPGASGITELADMTDRSREAIINNLNQISHLCDIILIDTGAGLSRNVRRFVTAADEAIVITTPDPTSITDAYSMVKIISQENEDLDVKLIVNMAYSLKEAAEISDRILLVVKQFLNKTIQTLGFIEFDTSLRAAIRNQRPILLDSPGSNICRSINAIANKISKTKAPVQSGGIKSFISRLIRG